MHSVAASFNMGSLKRFFLYLKKAVILMSQSKTYAFFLTMFFKSFSLTLTFIFSALLFFLITQRECNRRGIG